MREIDNIPVHRQIMMNAMRQKVRRQEVGRIRQPVIDVEQESMHAVFNDRPYEVSEEEAHQCLGEGGCRDEGQVRETRNEEDGGVDASELKSGTGEEVCNDREPEGGDDIPGGAGEDLLQKVRWWHGSMTRDKPPDIRDQTNVQTEPNVSADGLAANRRLCCFEGEN